VRKGVVRFVGNCRYLGHHHEDRGDSEGGTRRAIVFELEVGGMVQTGSAPLVSSSSSTPSSNSLEQLREAALSAAPQSSEPKVRLAHVHYRAEAVKRYVLKRSGGRCEGCKQEAPFKNRRGQPYLEPHHTTRRADGGPDSPCHVIALCPNCHRRVHSGSDGNAYNKRLIEVLLELEPQAS
jgi:5-methylcytosine-specific restriction protein A